MNENPEGTPNPLTPAPEAAAPAPTPAPAEEATVAPVVSETGSATSEPVATSEPAATTEPVAVAPKKKKTGLIVGLILGFLAIVGVVVTLLFVFVFNKGGDPANEALLRLMNGDERNIAISGSYDTEFMGLPIAINFNAQMDTAAKAGLAAANLSTNADGFEASIDLEARITGNDVAYIKVTGITDILSNAFGTDCKTNDCISALRTMAPALGSYSQYIDIIASIVSLDDQWIKIDNVGLSSLPLPAGLDISDINSHKNEIIDSYKKDPFISSDTKDIKISKKANPIYRLNFDYDKMANFINEIISKNCDSNSSCGMKGMTSSELKSYLGDLSNIYAEIDEKNNFTRLYVEISDSDPMDYTIAYPTNINVAEPDEYITMDKVMSLFESISNFMNGFMNSSDCRDKCVIEEDTSTSDFDWIWDEKED